MLRRRIGWIGIDIGSRSVKAAQVERAPTGALRLLQGVVVPRQRPWCDADEGAAPLHPSADEIVAAINFGDRFSGRSAACALPMHVYGFRGMHIPSGSHEERITMISSDLDDTWDEYPAQCEFDYWETDIGNTRLRQDEPNINVLALSRPWTRQLTEDAAQARLQLEVLDGPPLTMARAVKLASGRRSAATAAAVDWGYSSTTFCVIRDGQALFTRRVRDCGVRLVCEAIGKSLGVSLEETQHLLSTFGLPANNDGKPPHPLKRAMAGAAAEPLARLVDEIQRTLTYFRVQRKDLTPDAIWLMGGGASIPGAAEWFAAACDVPVTTWRIAGDEGDQLATGDDRDRREPTFRAPLLAMAIALSALPFSKTSRR